MIGRWQMMRPPVLPVPEDDEAIIAWFMMEEM
jgi:hypothetical protein